MTKYIYALLLLILSKTSIQNTAAQSNYKASSFEIGMDIGGMVSLSPLTPYGRLGAWKQISAPSIDFFIEKPIIGPVSIRGKFFLGTYGEDDSKTQGYSNWDWLKEYRKVKFSTSVKEVTGMVVFNLLRGEPTETNPHKISAYVFAGAGVAFVNVTRNWQNFDREYFLVDNPSLVEDLARDTAHALPNKAFVIPLGGGLKYAISPKFSLLGEVNFRYTKQQYLDGFYNVGNNQRNVGYNLKKDDYYYGVSIGISYRINTLTMGGASKGKLGCPKVFY